MKNAGWRSFYQLIKSTKPSKVYLSVAILLTLSSTGISLITPLFIKDFIDTFSLSQVNPMIVLLLLFLIIGQAVMFGLSMYMLNKMGQKIVANLRKRLLDKYLSLPVPFYDDNKSGELVSRLLYDTSAIRAVITYSA